MLVTVIAVVLIVAAAIGVVLVALVFVGDAVSKTSDMPPQIVVDSHEAIDFCAEALPEEITAVLSFDELRRALRLHLEWIQAFHFAPDTGDEGPIVFEQFDAVDYLMERADLVRLDITRAQAAAIVDVHSSYLQVVGAVHLDDPVQVEADLAELPTRRSEPGELEGGPDDHPLDGSSP